MTNTTNNPSSLDAAALVALGLLGAGVAVGAGALLGDADRRNACGQILRDLGVPQACRAAASMILFTAAKAVRGHLDPLAVE